MKCIRICQKVTKPIIKLPIDMNIENRINTTAYAINMSASRMGAWDMETLRVIRDGWCEFGEGGGERKLPSVNSTMAA